MNEMNEISKKQILDALIKSRDHWYSDNACMSEREYRNCIESRNFKTYAEDCALCILFLGIRPDGTQSLILGNCDKCPLHKEYNGCCCREWEEVSYLVNYINEIGRIGHYDKFINYMNEIGRIGNYDKFIKASEKMVKRLDREIDKLKKELTI